MNYFLKLSAVFDVFSEADLGITKNSLLHAGMVEGSMCSNTTSIRDVF